ncbi:hypothetical protein QSH46_022150 [Xanthomonas arboricola pv. juglandis]|uniref:hypothetical protein n=1 Tax=Xanthomonas arboricola TaxID=56448 RepID=UPI00063ECBAF|nr:hypothetical protein [Xanthomonas arboricola]MDN0221889.1 hypothetical protein [Xanthomonas arboricola pv. juglandis]MDN0226114.1 hypothetical protein [Xanthomonas arboricola pv. juglandis]MDN0230385.1 hypothetical protein [Xanthomonas arboricola pv. juglandis]MDN0235560.1 hypothetical protein [Xanthomonas arboricola pv. juglandis]MDN0239809.1 hypothetical protein [Xanthomonas arboricola pv. juglandis]
MATPDSEYFHELPPLTSDIVAELGAGQELTLFLLEYVPSGGGVIFPVQYIHRELVYRTPGQKDAVALGTARLIDGGEFRDARILFSRPNQTATLRGLTLEGQVKAARPGPNNSFKPTPLRGSA